MQLDAMSSAHARKKCELKQNKKESSGSAILFAKSSAMSRQVCMLVVLI
jgi:hypothetical protein